MNKSELKKISIQFRTLASQMLKIDSDSEVGHIKAFIDFIDSVPIISAYLADCHSRDYNIIADMQSKGSWRPVPLPAKQEEMIDYVYQILKLITQNENLFRVWPCSYSSSKHLADNYQAFMRKTVEPFVHALRCFLEIQLVDADVHSPFGEAKKKIFLSYCQRDSCIADLVENALSKQIEPFGMISRDIRDVKYKESFRKFMETIGQHDYVIMILSDNYFKSRNCLYEVLEVMRDRNYSEKLLFIILRDTDCAFYSEQPTSPIGAHVYDTEGQTSYISYWQQQSRKLENQIASIASPVLSIEQAKELKIVSKILLDLPDFMAYLQEHNGVSFSKLKESGFQEIVENISK